MGERVWVMPFRLLKPGEVDEPKGVLITGQPNSGKTASLVTFLNAYPDKKAAYISYPNEHGSSSFPADHPNVLVRAVYEDAEAGAKINYNAMWTEIEVLTADIIVGKHGPVELFFGDGLHKMYSIALAKATGGISAVSLDFDSKLYADASKIVLKYLSMIQRAPSLYLPVFTVWEGREKDNPDSQEKRPVRHIFPELPGQMAKMVLGEFGVVLYATKQGNEYKWLTRPLGDVWGAGIKLPIEASKAIDTFVPQDWTLLAKKVGM